MSNKKKVLSQPPSKKKVFFHSCHSRQFSGFGKNCKNILKYLHSTGKYEIIEFANAYKENDPTLKTLPWKCIGSGPSDPQEIIKHNSNPDSSKRMSYGLLNIDKFIKEEKPDVYIGAEDIWALMELTNKPWWNKINCMIWTTLDSLPIFPEAINLGNTIKHYYTWATFASDALREKNIKHANCLHGAVETKNFFKMKEEERSALRKFHKLGDEFIVGFVFRNQLRKSVPNLLKGFQDFKNNISSDQKTKLLLHTGWHEGWDITSLMIENGINQNDVLTTYLCKNCKKYSIKPFTTRNEDCPFCQSKKTLSTITVKDSPTEKQLNEIYNLMDVYCHPFTSGGQEIPIQEAKLTELITLSTNYSCGTDMCKPNSGGFPLKWSEFREQTTQFIKASTDHQSISENLLMVLKLSDEEKKSLGKQAREFVINNYSVPVIGKKLESIIDNMPDIDYDFVFEKRKLNLDFKPKEELNDLEWLIDIYKNMLGVYQTQHDKDVQYWMEKISEGAKRKDLYKKFQSICRMELDKRENDKKLDDFLSKEKEKVVGVRAEANEYHVLMASSFIDSIKKEPCYKNSKLIFFCPHEYKDVIHNNQNIDLIIPPDQRTLDHKFLSKHFKSFINVDLILSQNPEQITQSEINQFA